MKAYAAVPRYFTCVLVAYFTNPSPSPPPPTLKKLSISSYPIFQQVRALHLRICLLLTIYSPIRLMCRDSRISLAPS